jgi:hypothetical protein
MRELLARLDQLAAQYAEILRVLHPTLPDVVLDWSAPFRHLRTFMCKMHNFERLLAPVYESQLQRSGITRTAETNQLLFVMQYARIKLAGLFDALLLIAVGGDVHRLKEIDALLRNFFSRSSMTRWLTQGRTAHAYFNLLRIVSTPELTAYVAGLFGGTDCDEWRKITQVAVCIDSPELSFAILCFIALSKTATKEIADLCGVVVGLLCSPAHRVAIRLAAAMYPMHKRWARQADCKSSCVPANTISTHAFEVVQQDMDIVKEMVNLQNDWTEVLPVEHAYLLSEANRAVELKFSDDAGAFVQLLRKRMHDGLQRTIAPLGKYFIDPYLQPGFLLLHLYCSLSAPYCAYALLEGLYCDGYLRGPLPPAPPAATLLYPNLSGAQFVARLRLALLCPVERDALQRAAGLRSPTILSELLQIAAEKYGGPDPTAVPRQSAAERFLLMRRAYPGIAFAMWRNYSSLSTTSTTVEQMFSTCTSICRPTAAPASNIDSIDFFYNIRKECIDMVQDRQRTNSQSDTSPQQQEQQPTMMMEVQGSPADDQEEVQQAGLPAMQAPADERKVTLRAFEDRTQYSRECIAVGATLSASAVGSAPTVREARGVGKRKADMLYNQEERVAIMEKNSKKRRGVDADKVLSIIQDVHDAKIAHQEKLCIRLTSGEKAKRMTKAQIVAALGVAAGSQEGKALLRKTKDVLVGQILQLWSAAGPNDQQGDEGEEIDAAEGEGEQEEGEEDTALDM